MTAKGRGRDPRYNREIGARPHLGRRFVEGGRVRIQWTEQGKRRSRTIGPNSAENRRRADAELEEILRGMPKSPEDTQKSAADVRAQVQEALRGAAVSLMEAADRLVDWIEHDLELPVPPWAAGDEAEASEEPEEVEVEVEDESEK
jgi:hypothetical protein